MGAEHVMSLVNKKKHLQGDHRILETNLFWTQLPEVYFLFKTQEIQYAFIVYERLKSKKLKTRFSYCTFIYSNFCLIYRDHICLPRGLWRLSLVTAWYLSSFLLQRVEMCWKKCCIGSAQNCTFTSISRLLKNSLLKHKKYPICRLCRDDFLTITLSLTKSYHLNLPSAALEIEMHQHTATLFSDFTHWFHNSLSFDNTSWKQFMSNKKIKQNENYIAENRSFL